MRFTLCWFGSQECTLSTLTLQQVTGFYQRAIKKTENKTSEEKQSESVARFLAAWQHVQRVNQGYILNEKEGLVKTLQ